MLSAACGMGLGAGDPASVQQKMVVVHHRTSELKACLSSKNGRIPMDLGKSVGLFSKLSTSM